MSFAGGNMGKIVAIHSFRGGTGKSNVTANLAAQAALQGKRVGVVDSDIQSPGIHVLFGLDETNMGNTLNDFLHGKCTIREVAFSVGDHPGLSEQLAGKYLWLFPSSIRRQEISRILRDGFDINLLNAGLQTLMSEFDLDCLFIDTHPGLNEETLLSIAISDLLLVLLRPDVQDFQGTAVTVDIARSLDVPNLMLMVNKAVPGYDYDDLKSQIEGVYKAPLAGILPLNFELADNASKDLFSLSNPLHPWSTELRKVTEAVLSVP
jgi:MinD-like ATPase involved in chromosome partitioning or flagellar assembly